MLKMKMLNKLLVVVSCFLFSFFTDASNSEDYKPLIKQNKYDEFNISGFIDTIRTREIPLKLYLPKKNTPSPVILYSHGLGGSKEGSRYLGEHWASRGYIVVYLQHPGSDISVWQNIPKKRKLKRLRAIIKAANAENFVLRVGDVYAVLDQLNNWNETPDHQFNNIFDLTKIGMSGHSFGAQTTQAVSGQKLTGRGEESKDKRINAALLMSPSIQDFSSKGDFESISIPWMIMTGTKDSVRGIGSNNDAEARLEVFSALPFGNKYELVLNEARHYAFTDINLMNRSESRNPNHHEAILALSTAFWDAYLRADKQAREWLDGGGPSSILETKDSWQTK